jgi:hypothetical protein
MPKEACIHLRYADGQGNFVLHNDANYQINTDPAFNSRDWQRIEPVP